MNTARYCRSRRAPTLYDFAYQVVDVAAECEYLFGLARRSGLTECARILDVGCGPAHHLRCFKAMGYEVRGIDRDRNMLAHAARLARNERTTLVLQQADMRAFRVARRYNLLLCLGASFNSLASESDALATLRAMRAAIATKGRIILEVHEPRAVYRDDPIVEWAVSTDEGVARCKFVLTRTEVKDRYKWDIEVDLRRRRGVRIERARFSTTARPWTRDELKRIARSAGLQLVGWTTPSIPQYRTCVFALLAAR